MFYVIVLPPTHSRSDEYKLVGVFQKKKEKTSWFNHFEQTCLHFITSTLIDELLFLILHSYDLKNWYALLLFFLNTKIY